MSEEGQRTTLEERLAALTGQTPTETKAPSPHSAAHIIQNSSFVNNGTTEANIDAHYRVTDKPRARATEINLSDKTSNLLVEGIDAGQTFIDPDHVRKRPNAPEKKSIFPQRGENIVPNQRLIDDFAGGIEKLIAQNSANTESADPTAAEIAAQKTKAFQTDDGAIAKRAGAAGAAITAYNEQPFIEFRGPEAQRSAAESIYPSDSGSRLPFRGMKEDPTPAKPLLSPEDEARLIAGTNEIEEIDLDQTPVPE